MKNYMILKYDISSVFFSYLEQEEIDSFYCKINKTILKIFSKLNLNFLFFGNWKKKVKSLDTIIIFDNQYKENIAKYIKKKNPNCKIIFYYWNLINSYNRYVLEDANIDEIWTFDKMDAKEYHLKWNPQFYTKKVKIDLSPLKYDILFLGRDKGRENFINEINSSFELLELNAKLIIIKNESDFIEYNEYLKLVGESKGLLDIVAPGQMGLTLRTMESLFLEKKLITNNKDIKNYDFYNKNNIFIIGEDDMNTLVNFIQKPYTKIPKEIVDYYDYENWVKRFFESK